MLLIHKTIGTLLSPLPLVVFFLLAGLIFLFFTQKQSTGRVLVAIGFLLIIAFSYAPLPTALVENLEHQYPPLKEFPYRANTIVVLGAGVRHDAKGPPNTRLNSTSLARLVEGVRVYRLCKLVQARCRLILSGGRVFGALNSEAGVMQNTAVLLGVDPEDMRVENGSRNTQEEAMYLKRRLGHTPFVLVTSAIHGRRALYIFRELKMKSILAPTQYLQAHVHFRDPRSYFPSETNLLLSHIAVHEYLGIWWRQLNSWAKTLY